MRPGRAGFLTGSHTHHRGTNKTDGSLFKPGETIATALTRSGYHTVQVGKYRGISFLDLLAGDRKWLSRTAVLTSYQDGNHLVPTYWSITTTARSPLADKVCAQRNRGACRSRYTEYETGERELYDLSNGPCWQWQKGHKGDPCELQNRAGVKGYAALEQRLQAQLNRLHQ